MLVLGDRRPPGGSTEGISDLPDEALPEALRPVRERLRAAAEAETEEV